MKPNDKNPGIQQLAGVTIFNDRPPTKNCPECTRAFKLDHMSRKFCSDQCKDIFFNRIKRNNRIAEAVISEQSTEKILQKEESGTVAAQMEKNLELIQTINPGTAGKLVFYADLEREGYDLAVYEGRYPLDKAGKHFFISIGPFEIALIYPDRIFIQQKQ